MNKPKLNSNQQAVLELLKKSYVKNRWMTPFGAVYSVVNENDFAIRAWLIGKEKVRLTFTLDLNSASSIAFAAGYSSLLPS